MKRMKWLVSSDMRLNDPFVFVRQRTGHASATTAAVRPYAVAKPGGRGRSDAGDGRACAALKSTMAARDEPRQLGLSDHAQPVDRHGPVALAQGADRSACRGSRA